MSSTPTVIAGPPLTEVPPPPPPGFVTRYGISMIFLGPAIFFLGVWAVYPTIRTIIRSFYSNDGKRFVGIDNYKDIFTDHVLLTAVKNNAIWVLVVPAAVTALGLLFAVLTERVSWAVAFKVVVFAPLAVSLFATGVMWRVIYQKDPDAGAVNAALRSITDIWKTPGPLTGAAPSSATETGGPGGGIVLKTPLHPGGVALLGLTAIPATDIPASAKQAVKPSPVSNGVVGTVWRDFKPGGGKPGVVESQELGLPGVTVVLRDSSGKKVGSTKTADDGTFKFTDLKSGSYQAAIGKSTFAKPFGGVNWLGDKLITPAMIIAYLWASAGFAMVVIAAGLAAIPRDVLEAARTDGGTEWQVFRRVTVPLLAPVLTVVFVTQLIGVLKIFDIVLSIAPGSTQSSATVLAFEMWKRSFSGQNAFGTGSAIATFILVLVIPILVLRIRSFRREVQ